MKKKLINKGDKIKKQRTTVRSHSNAKNNNKNKPSQWLAQTDTTDRQRLNKTN